MSGLFQRRKVRWIEIHRFNLLDDGAIFLGFGCQLDEFGVLAEIVPVFVRGGAAGMNEQEDQRLAGERRVLRNSIADAVDAVTLQDSDVEVAEIGFERFELALVAVVSSEFIDACLRPAGGGNGDEQQEQATPAQHPTAGNGERRFHL
jgi:hypothetical protein